MLKTYLPLALTFLFFLPLTAQDLSGSLFSKETNESIPYASVEIGKNYGVITNNEGEFQINVDRFTEKDSLRFSSLGYQSTRIALKDFVQDTIIYLKEDVSELEDVYLINKKLSPQEIMAKVNENLAKNYNYSLRQYDLFIRNESDNEILDAEFEINKATFLEKKVTKKFNTELEELLKTTKNVTSKSYSEKFIRVSLGEKIDSLKVDIQKATVLKDTTQSSDVESFSSEVMKKIGQNLNSENTFKVKSGILPIDDSLKVGKKFKVQTKKSDSIYTKNLKESYVDYFKYNDKLNLGKFDFVREYEDYAYTIEDITGFNGEMVYILSFEPDRGRADYLGKLYVSAESFAIIKAEYHLEEGEKASGINMKFLLGIKAEQTKDTGLIIFKKNENNTYDPVYAKSETNQYIYFNRSFKFKENTEDRSKRIKFKFDMLVENQSNMNTEILFVNSSPVTSEQFNSIEENKGKKLDYIRKYDASVWEGYNIISPDRELEEFEL